MEADVEPYGTCHENIVVASVDGAKRSVLLSFIVRHFVDSIFVSLYVEFVAYGVDERGDDDGFCFGVRMEPVGSFHPVLDFIFSIVASCIEVRVDVRNEVQNI